MNIEALKAKRGKIDRDKEHQRRRYTSGFGLTPRTPLEQTIKDFHDNYKEKIGKTDRTVDDTTNMYINIRKCRHDVWVDLLNELTVDTSYVFGDTHTETFIKQNFPNYNFDSNINYRLTPDILLLVHQGQYVLLGDVSVVRSVDAGDQSKYFKYHDIEKDLQKNNILVRHVNLIIDETLNNYKTQLQKFIDLEVIAPSDEKILRAREYHKTCQIMMEQLPKQCSNTNLFKINRDQRDRMTYDDSTINIDADIILQNPMLDITTTMTEREIGQMIKDEVEKNKGFFDNKIEDSMKSFERLLDKNKTREYMEPKSVLKVVSNQSELEDMSGYDLILDYVRDLHMNESNEVRNYILDILPTSKQVEIMKRIYSDKAKNRKASKDDKNNKVFGPHQYSRNRNPTNQLTNKMNDELTKGKKNKNIKREPKTINPDDYDDCYEKIEKTIRYYGQRSLKPSFLDDTWDCKTNFEKESSKEELDIYNYVKSTNGSQLCHSMSNFYQRAMHLRTSLSIRDNIYVPPNGSFICVVPKEHAPISTSNCDLPMVFISRCLKNRRTTETVLGGNEYEYKFESENYIYMVSKLCRFNMQKISHWDQLGYKIVSTCTYLLSTCKELRISSERVVGILTLLMMDGHQKTSEYLDLLKYIAFMPFSDVSRLSRLIEDKCDIMIKTRLDIWLIKTLMLFIKELSNIDMLNAVKPKLQLFNSSVTRDSLGITMSLPSFLDVNIRHKTVASFIEEIAMVYIVRPKQLYGSQFMDKSITNTALWNSEYENEIVNHKGWATVGYEKGKKFPFDAKFCFSRDAIIHANKYMQDRIAPQPREIERKLQKTTYNTYMHYNCSLRGCIKSKQYRQTVTDIHTTSLDECLRHYHDVNFDDKQCTAIFMATKGIKSLNTMQFSMAEKEQRGGGRPIATPDILTKAQLMMVEKPEQAIGTFVGNNIIVSGKNKLQAQSNTYKSLLANGSISNFKHIYQLTEDQSKFSENDNVNKYFYYVSSNDLLPRNIRSMQLAVLKKISSREHLVKRMPKSISKDPNLAKYRTSSLNGIRAVIGWPQGMLNFISTSVHSIADYWITMLYNMMYPDNQVMTEGLVHSDDSWLSVACNSLDDFKTFTLFRTFAKKLFCLKLNDKKVWGSKYLGELVSNYNINGNVHLSVAKTLANSFGNLIYQNWTMDVHTQVSSIQQAYRNGANIPTLIMLSTILRQQMLDCYQVSGFHKENVFLLPIEMGGYPDTSAFELGVTGVTSHYSQIIEYIKTNPDDVISRVILKALTLSIMHNVDKEKMSDTVEQAYKQKTNLLSLFPRVQTLNEMDYQSVTIPSRGEVFSCIKHIMPKSKKIARTIRQIELLPFVSDGLEMIITRPNDLSTALGHLKSQTSTMLYQLAAEKYTQSTRRLAISQSIQSSGKVVRVCNFNPMTINEMLYFIDQSEVALSTAEMLEVALNDETDISLLCESCVYRSTPELLGVDKRRIINKMPDVNDKFKTVCRLQSVLLYIIDMKEGTKFRETYTRLTEPIEVLKTDSDLIKRRFNAYFRYYKTRYCVNLIMQQYLARNKARLWMQPHINNETMSTFIGDLYGKTINSVNNYSMRYLIYGDQSNKVDVDFINSLYTTAILNEMYEKKLRLESIGNRGYKEIIKKIDYANLQNDDYLKYAVICKYYLDDINHLKEYDTRKMYDQYYIKPQVYDGEKWVGKFSCITRYGNTVVKYDGEPEDITITTNKANIHDILQSMHIFVNKNFKYYTYPHPNNWANSRFWETKFKLSLLFLTSHNSVLTSITQRSSMCSVSLVIDPNMKMPPTYNNLDSDDYTLDETLRVVLKNVEGSIVRVASVQQALSCPNAESIKVVPDLIDGFDNNKLINSRLLINITLKRYFNCPRTLLYELLADKTPSINGDPLIHFYLNIMNYFGENNLPITTSAADQVTDIETYQITGFSTATFIEKHVETTPEDLTYIESELVYDDEERVGCLYKHENLTRLISSILCNAFSRADVQDIIQLMFNNSTLVENIMGDLDLDVEELNEKIEILKDSSSILEVPLELKVFILGLNLDREETAEKYDLGYILDRTAYISNVRSYDISKKLCNSILLNIYEVDVQQDTALEKLKLRLKKKQDNERGPDTDAVNRMFLLGG